MSRQSRTIRCSPEAYTEIAHAAASTGFSLCQALDVLLQQVADIFGLWNCRQCNEEFYREEDAGSHVMATGHKVYDDRPNPSFGHPGDASAAQARQLRQYTH